MKSSGFLNNYKLLVAVADYPNPDGGVKLMYVHVRNKSYHENGADVTVLNFKTNNDYVIDGIKVISLKTYLKSKQNFDMLISHAPNIRNHYRFLKKNQKKFNKLLFFFHGHEVEKITRVYPEPYFFNKKNIFRKSLQKCYDNLKLKLWHSYLPKLANKSSFIFVSNDFKNIAMNFLKLSEEDLNKNVHVINNSVGKIFEEQTYNADCEKEYDFISIRSTMDDATYCVDLVTEFAKKYPQYKFLVIGKGNFYKHVKKPENVTWVNTHLSHEDMLNKIDSAKCALMPTRKDTQGVMSCELVTYGIPLITSGIPICEEVFDGISNVKFIDNNPDKVDLENVYTNLLSNLHCDKPTKYSYVNTILKEEKLIKGMLE